MGLSYGKTDHSFYSFVQNHEVHVVEAAFQSGTKKCKTHTFPFFPLCETAAVIAREREKGVGGEGSKDATSCCFPPLFSLYFSSASPGGHVRLLFQPGGGGWYNHYSDGSRALEGQEGGESVVVVSWEEGRAIRWKSGSKCRHRKWVRQSSILPCS